MYLKFSIVLIASILLTAIFTAKIIERQKQSFNLDIYSEINHHTDSKNFISELKFDYTIVNTETGSQKEYRKEVLFRSDGSKISESNYINSQLNGSYIKWYENEIKKSEETWKNNLKEGNVRSYSSTGEIIAEGTYQNGKPWNGTFRLAGGHENRNPYQWTISTYKDGKLVEEIPEQ